ncbi:MAG: energy-coupling factor transporter transmembrane protein EcfT [Candidatus Methanoplasma sp.]|jgi:cobalt ECF transporter T component CbiQ|nr:energy-coupling factor transporter transmembrane protein EcfT [Candidatus Methanoplasma sp.]
MAISEYNQMDALAYGSRMLNWAPLGKLFLAASLLAVDLISSSFIVPMATAVIGISLMAYSTNLRLPKIVGLLILESLAIIIICSALVSVMPSEGTTIRELSVLGIKLTITDQSFNYALLIFTRSFAGITVMLAFATSTPIPFFANSLRQLRIPPEIVELTVLIYRYSFLMLEQLQTLWNAASSRLGFSSFKRSVHSAASIAVNIFITSLDMAERSGNALACRNFTGTFPVFRPPRRLSALWIAGIAAIAAVLYAVGRYTEGWIDPASLLFGAG